MKKAKKLDRSKPFDEVTGPNGVRYEQAGILFGADERAIGQIGNGLPQGDEKPAAPESTAPGVPEVPQGDEKPAVPESSAPEENDSTPGPDQPPVDNAHVENGAEQFTSAEEPEAPAATETVAVRKPKTLNRQKPYGEVTGPSDDGHRYVQNGLKFGPDGIEIMEDADGKA